jgi:hypothetical protein
MAYVSNESGSPDVYVQRFPATADKWPVSIGGGIQPRWRADGKELFYLSADFRLMAVEVKEDVGFRAGAAQPVFETAPFLFPGPSTRYRYAVTADGQRFLFLTPAGETASSPLTVVVNWAAELKR